MAAKNSDAAAPGVTSTACGETSSMAPIDLAQRRIAEVVAVAEEQIVEIDIDGEIAQPPVGDRALGQVVGDRVVPELLR